MCWRSKRSRTWGVTVCHLYCSFRKTCHLNVLKLDLALLSFRIVFTLSVTQTSTAKLPWTTSVRDLPLWKQHLLCPRTLKKGIHISGLEELSFLYAPMEKKTLLLPPILCHPPNQTLWLNCLAQSDFNHWTLNPAYVTTAWGYQHRWTLRSTRSAEAGAPISHPGLEHPSAAHQAHHSRKNTASSCSPRTLLLAAMASRHGAGSPKPPASRPVGLRVFSS